MDNVEERIKGIFANSFDIKPQQVTLEANLKNDLKMDSTEVVELVVALEKEFEIQIGDDEITNKHCVTDVVKIIKDKLKQ